MPQTTLEPETPQQPTLAQRVLLLAIEQDRDFQRGAAEAAEATLDRMIAEVKFASGLQG